MSRSGIKDETTTCKETRFCEKGIKGVLFNTKLKHKKCCSIKGRYANYLSGKVLRKICSIGLSEKHAIDIEKKKSMLQYFKVSNQESSRIAKTSFRKE